MLLPFVAKPFHLDDPMYVWVARHIVAHPLDPYGFDVNWLGHVEPMATAMQNPPLVPYYLAAASRVVGFGEVGLHVAMLPWAVLAAVGAYELARSFGCRRPLAAAGLTVATPAFVVSATTVMCELPLLALWTWAVVAWVRSSAGVGRRAWAGLLAAGGLTAAATMAKYPGVNLVPLLLAHAVHCPAPRRTRAAQAVALLIPVVALVGYDRYTAARYGVGLIGGAVRYTHSAAAASPVGPGGRLLDTLCYVGGAGLPIAAVAVVAARRGLALTAVGVIAAAVASRRFYDSPGTLLFLAQLGGMASLGAALCLACWRGTVVGDRRRGLLLLAWVAGVFAFAAVLNWAINVRSILPLMPAAAVLVVRATDRHAWRPAFTVAAAVGGVVAIAVAVADYRYAVVDRALARAVTERAGTSHLWIASPWGVQFYAEQRGATRLDAGHPDDCRPGDAVAYPLYPDGSDHPPIAVGSSTRVRVGSTPAWLSTVGNDVGAGFYYSPGTWLPFAVGRVDPRTYVVGRVAR